MTGNNSMKPGYKIEKKFKDFMKKLLDAQSYDFMKEKVLFSRKTLKRTLTKFCNIIADELDCESCTIHLQMYDSKMMDEESLKKYIVEHLLKAYKCYVGDKEKIEKEKKLREILAIIVNPDSDHGKAENLKKLPDNFREFVKSRIDFLTSSLTFPYWAYAEGAASLVALNKDGPWTPIMEKRNSRLKYISPYRGVSKFIFKENVAKVRDRLSIRETRNFKKLGNADMIVWNNTSWKYVFKNYYGVPIRIHSGGEVVGILKAENKRTYGKKEKKIIENLLKVGSTNELINGIIEEIDVKFKECKDLDLLNVSFLSLVYLKNDLKSDECEKQIKDEKGFEKLIFIAYPEYVTKVLGKILERMKEDLSISISEGESQNPIKHLKKLVSDSNEGLTNLFDKKRILLDIFNNIIGAFFHSKEDLEKLKKYMDELEQSDISEFKGKVGLILEEFDLKINRANIASLIPASDEIMRPPMQLFTKSIEDERRLWKLINKNKKKENTRVCDYLYESINELYDAFKEEIFDKIAYKNGESDLSGITPINFDNKLSKIITGYKKGLQINNLVESKLPDFHFKVSLSFTIGKPIDFYIVVPPTRDEIIDNHISIKNEVFKEDQNYRTDFYNHYKNVNQIWTDNDKKELDNYCTHRGKNNKNSQGEFVIINDSNRDIEATDLILDRLAARIQAFAHALPLGEFSADDTYKLTWAAYEIGKLIEREISYRANRHINPIPLTAMEFYRIPISSLSFVDDLIGRRTDLKKIADNIDVYIKNIIFEMDMIDEIEYSSRMKEYRSMFQRIGERFEGYIRGNIALWVFLLYFVLENDKKNRKKYLEDNKNLIEKEERSRKEVNHGKGFLKNLEKFAKNIKESLDETDFFDIFFKNKESKRIYGDLKFDSPPFLDANNLLYLYRTKKDVEEIQPQEKIEDSKIEEVVKKLLEIIRYQTIKFKIKGDNKTSSCQEEFTCDYDFDMLRKSINNMIQSLNDFKKKPKEERTEARFSDLPDFEKNLENIESKLESIFKKEKKDYKEKLKDAFNLIRFNLEKEGFKKENFEDIGTETGIKDYFKDNRELLTDLLLQNYSYFIRDSLSLLIQIANLLRSLESNNMEAFERFKEFYKKCRELREFLCSSPQQLEGKEKDHLEKIFSIGENSDNETNGWAEIKEFINSNTTNSVFANGDEDYLYLNQKSIYKRIRKLNHILHRQIPVAMLDWELGRFDLYGTRMNCLFKNQVFVLYEKIWNKGDPFFFYMPDAEVLKDYYYYNNKSKEIDTDKYRQRWICFRTKLLQGEYNATQIAALLDPKTAEPVYWEHINTYNLKSVQYVLGKIFDAFEERAAWKYRNFSWHRNLISECHHKWYKYKASLLQKGIPHENNIPEKTRWFGSFLFSGVINLLLLLLHCTIDHKNVSGSPNRYGFHKDTLEIIYNKIIYNKMNETDLEKNDFYNIMKDIDEVIKSGLKYSDEINKAFMDDKLLSQISFVCNCKGTGKSLGRNEGNNCDKLLVCLHPQKKDDKCLLYDNAVNFVENIIDAINSKTNTTSPGKHQMVFDKDIFDKIKTNLEEEKKFYLGLKKDNSIKKGHQIPLFFIDKNQQDRFGHQTLDVFKSIMKDPKKRLLEEKTGMNNWAIIYRTLEHIRREQNSYLFDKGDKDTDHGGLWMREKKEILDRIKNYVLLYSEKYIDEVNKRRFLGWNAHDLYYYIHSLIPMEIQIRTELTNTFAVQYHDSIYKVQPSPGTKFPHSMIKYTGESLDKIDRELEIDYEDYILKYRHKIEEEDEDL